MVEDCKDIRGKARGAFLSGQECVGLGEGRNPTDCEDANSCDSPFFVAVLQKITELQPNCRGTASKDK